jgi:predicted RND superfamily exporter protein
MKPFSLFLQKYDIPLLLISLGLIVGAAFGMTQLSFHSGIKVFFDKTDAGYLSYVDGIKNFNGSDSLVVFLSVEEGTLVSADGLAAIDDLTERIESEDFVYRVDSIATLPYLVSDEDGAVVQSTMIDEIATISDEASYYANLEKALLDHPLYSDAIISKDATISVIQIVLDPERVTAHPYDVTEWLMELVSEARSQHSNIHFHYAGDRVVEHDMLATSVRDGLSVWPFVGLFGVTIIALSLRNLSGIALSGMLIFVVLVSNIGATGWLRIPLDQTSLMAIPVVFLCAVANSIHIISSYLRNLKAGATKADALILTYNNNTKAIILSALTTALGFFALNTTGSPVFKAMGNTVAIGVLINFVLTFTLLPFFLLKLPFQTETEKRASLFSVYLHRLARFTLTKRYPLSAVVVASIVLAVIVFPTTTLSLLRCWETSCTKCV